MSWPKDPFVTDSAYKTPLPCHPAERQLWRLVARLYEYDTLASLMKLNETPSTSLTGSRATDAPEPATTAAASSTSTTSAAAAGVAAATSAVTAPASPVRSTPRSTTSRAEMVERRSAFIAAASGTSPASSGTASPLTTQRGSSETLSGATVLVGTPGSSSAAAAGGGGRHSASSSAAAAAAAPPVTAVHSSQPTSPYITRVPLGGSWSNNNSLTGTTGFIRATSMRAIEPIRVFLSDLAVLRCELGAGVVDIAIQLPLPCLRIELVRTLLTYPFWSWAMCGPVAVAAGIGDVDVLQLLMEVDALDPNTGFPLVVAVRRRQEEAVLPFLLSHHRIRANYGGAFYCAVVVGNVAAMHLLGDAAGVNVNRFANNEGTSALLYALRQYLICRRAEQQLGLLSPPSSTPLLHAAKPHQGVTSPTHVALDDARAETEEQIAKTPLLTFHADGRRDNPLVGSGAEEASSEGEDGADGSDAARSATSPAESMTAAPPAAMTATMTPPRPVLRLPADGTHSAAFRRDTKERPLHSTRHWLEVLLYLLDHPAIEVNAGFYMTPLQISVLAGNAEVVSWLLQHPHLRPGRLPKATMVLGDSYYLLQHRALSPSAMQCVVATPIEMAAGLHRLDIFRLLARDQRIQVPVRLTVELERSAADGDVIPFLTVLAQHREEWEGWGWRWRRRCTIVAAVSLSVFAVCFWVMLLLWFSTLRRALLVFAGTYGAMMLVSLALLLWHVEALRHSPETSLTHGNTAVYAFVRHLFPSWSTLQLRVAVVVLVVCPGMLPVLDVLCAWCIFQVCRSRRKLHSGESSTAHDVPSHAVTPSAAVDRSRRSSSGSHQHQRHPYHRAHHQRGASDHGADMERLSSTASWGWSVGLSNGSDASTNSSCSEVPLGGPGGSGNDSFSRSRSAVARTRRQSGAAATATATTAAGTGSSASASASAAAANAPMLLSGALATSTSPPSGRQLSFASPTPGTGGGGGGGGHASGVAFPSMCTSRHRSPWVVPGRPSRYTLQQEYHAPDLLLRALAYTTYDTVLGLPRLLTCVVGFFMFMYLVFPSAAPHHAASTDALRGHSSFTLYYGTVQPAFSPAQPAAYNVGTAAATAFMEPLAAVAATATTAAATGADAPLPSYSVAIGFVGFWGLLSSIFGGAALLAMMGSLRTVTVHAFFTNPGERGDTTGGGGRVEGRTGGNSSWQAARHRAREAQPNYAL